MVVLRMHPGSWPLLSVVAHVWLPSQQKLGYCVHTPACFLCPAFLCRFVCAALARFQMDWLACCSWYAGAECAKDRARPCACLLSFAVRPDSACVAVAPVSGAACTAIAAGALACVCTMVGPTEVRLVWCSPQCQSPPLALQVATTRPH
jgi:hypothetical protein